ncbi:tetratricopeptide repeat protein [Mesorhizobium sp.]|uniref:tetratricopeptide repeat protein n=1 Tax=Mesorhizobium sp. TaxID=1871066 RepID=UPI0025EB59DD|nr:tetratricopeptide repeat protein [Mesorhizobium sp.]
MAALAGVYLWPMTKSGAEPPVIAVLPFENINGDARWNRFAMGVTEDIVTDLARYRDIPVIARSSMEAYRGKPHDVREIGRALNVKYVLEGSLQVDGHRMRVTAQLINAETGAHVWSERYDRPAAELLEVQDEITQKIAVTLTGWQGQVTEAERALMRRKNSADLDAYDYWLLGIEAKHRITPEGVIEARVLFEKGLKLAPDFMPLVRDMAVTYAVETDLGSAINYPAAVDAQRKYAKRALALDPNDATANNMMAVAYANQGDGEQAERFRKLALQFGPNNTDIMMQLAWLWRLADGTRHGAYRTDAEAQSALSPLVELSHHTNLFRGATVREGLCGCQADRRVAQPGRLSRHERRADRKEAGSGRGRRQGAACEPGLDGREYVPLPEFQGRDAAPRKRSQGRPAGLHDATAGQDIFWHIPAAAMRGTACESRFELTWTRPRSQISA